MTGDIVAEQHDQIRSQRVGPRHDGLDMRQRHPGIAGMDVGDRRDLQLEAYRPIARTNMIIGDAEAKRLDAHAIGGGGKTRGGEATGE